MGKKTNSHILNCLGVIMFQLQRQELFTGKIMSRLDGLEATLQGVNEKLVGLTAQADKISGEIDTLQTELSNVELPAGAQAALDAVVASASVLTGSLQALDDKNADAAAPTPAPEELG